MNEQELSVGMVVKIIAVIVGAIIAIWATFHTVSWKTVRGNEAMVEQHLTKGVLPDVKLSGTHFYMGWLSDMYVYDIGTQKITFDNTNDNRDAEYPRIEVNCGENGGQKAYIAISVNYRIGWEADKNGAPVFSPIKLVTLHKEGLRENYEAMVVKRTIVEIVNKIARPRHTLDIYSGQGFVDFVNAVEKELQDSDVFKERGIYVENTIIYSVHLDPAYEKEIADKVLAIQETLKLKEQTLAKEEEAKRIFAESAANVAKITQEAEAAKVKMVKNAEAEKEQAILKAEAEKKKRILEAEGNRDANLAIASGLLAVGEAEAKVSALKRDAAYAGESGSRRASVEIAGLQAEKLKGMLQGVNVISDKALFNMGTGTGVYTVTADGK